MRLPAARPVGAVAHARRARGMRRGIEEHLADAGFRFFFVDAHLAAAGRPLGLSGDPAGSIPTVHAGRSADRCRSRARSPYRAYRVRRTGAAGVAAFVRDPQASMQVWSRFEGYPGDGVVPRVPQDALARRPQVLAGERARRRPRRQAALRPGRRARTARAGTPIISRTCSATSPPAERSIADGVVVAPFDTELFGHWWFEGPDFLGDVYRALRGSGRCPARRPARGTCADIRRAPRSGCRAGSWGANGDFSMWLSEQTAWTWERLWPLEERFWDVAPAALGSPAARPVLAQAARELLLAQSSDWQFIISTGAAADYAERRFRQHCGDAEELVAALAGRAPSRAGAGATPRGGAGRARRAVPRCRCRPLRPRSAARAPSCSADHAADPLRVWAPSASTRRQLRSCVRAARGRRVSPAAGRLADREFLPVVLHLSGPLLEWLEQHDG